MFVLCWLFCNQQTVLGILEYSLGFRGMRPTPFWRWLVCSVIYSKEKGKEMKRMEEDDDILLEGSALDKYLKEQGYGDYEVMMVQRAEDQPEKGSFMTKVLCGVSRVAKFFPQMWMSANEERLKPLKIIPNQILESGILSEEDECYLRNLTENNNPTGALTIKPLWSLSTVLLGLSPSVLIFFVTRNKMHWCIPLIYSGSVFFHLLQLWLTDHAMKRCNAEAVNLLNACKEYTDMLVKAMRLLRENEVIAMKYDMSSACESERHIFERVKHERYLAVSFRHSIFFTLIETNRTLQQEVTNLRSVFPKILEFEHPGIIKNQLDNVEMTLRKAIADGKLPEMCYLKELVGVYQFLLAVFFRILGRNLLLNAWKSEKFDVSKLARIIAKVSHTCIQQSKIFKDSFNTFEEKSYVPSLSLPDRRMTNILTAHGIASAKNHLMAMLVGIKELDCLIDISVQNFDKALVAGKLKYLVKELNSIKGNLELGIIELEGSSALDKQEKPVPSKPIPESTETLREPEPLDLVSNFDPPGQDEVFIGTAVSNSDTLANDEPPSLLEEYEKLQRKYTVMINELKVVLRLKEEEMRERENRALGIDPSASQDNNDLEFRATREGKEDLNEPYNSADQSTQKEQISELDKDAVHETFQLPHFSSFGCFGTVNNQTMAGEEDMFTDEGDDSEDMMMSAESDGS